MALKNENDVSDFGKKLLALMIEKGCDTPKALATELYNSKLVVVNSRSDDVFKKKDNAIGSIEKKIRAHINSNGPDCLQGEFVLAYCKYFGCNADYLFGFTEVKSNNTDVRKICEGIGLSEGAVCNLVEDINSEVHERRINSWSMILESVLFSNIPDKWLEVGNHALLVAQMHAQLKAASLEMEYVSGPDILDLQNDIEGYENQLKAGSAAIEGILFNISRNIANFIEEQVSERVKPFQEKCEIAFVEEVKKRYNR